jgi:hypothetical protein
MKIKLDNIYALIFGILVFIVSRQFPFALLNSVANITTLILVILYLFRNKISVFQWYIFLSIVFSLNTFNLLYSIGIQENDFLFSLKSWVTIIILSLAFFIKLPYKIVNIFISIMAIHAIIVIGIFIYTILNYTYPNYMPIRFYFINNNFGDVFFNGFMYNVQIKGNALLVFSFLILNFYNIYSTKIKKRLNLLFLISILIAGNLTFIIVLIVYLISLFVKEFFQNITRFKLLILLVLSFFIICITPVLFSYINNQINKKEAGVSNPTRYEQFDLLIDNLNKDYYSMLLGRGFGNKLKVIGKYRDYSNEEYYELQVVYFLNQMGYISFILFVIYNSVMCKIYFDKKKILLFLFFIVSGISNPYILNTYQFIAIIVLNSLPNNSKPKFI